MFEGVVGASHTGFQVPQQGVDPVQWLCLGCFSPTSCDIALMRGLRRFDLSKSMGAITDHMAAGGEIALCPLLHGFLCEILDGGEPHVQRPPLICRLYSRDKGCLVGWFELRVQRAEPLVDLARLMRVNQRYARAYLYASQACKLPVSTDSLFVESAMYGWMRWDELSIAAYWVGEYQESLALCDRLLDDAD